MANPQKGEVAIVAGDATYTWCFSVNAIATLEAHLDRGVFDIAEEIQSWSPKAGVVETPADERVRMKRVRIGFLRAVFWSGFADAHKGITLDQAGAIMTEAGGVLGTLQIVLHGMAIAFPQPEARGTTNPPQAPAPSDGTGPAS